MMFNSKSGGIMKKVTKAFFAFIVLMVFQSVALAQITITTSDLSNFFGPGTSWFAYQNEDSIETMDVGSASSSAQTWTLPSVTFIIGDSSRADNVSPSATPYAAKFPQASYAQQQIGVQPPYALEYYQYIGISNDSLYVYGAAEHYTASIGGQTIDTTIFVMSQELIAHFPIHLGDTVSVTVDTTNFGGSYIDVITTVDIFDAYGTLNLPNGSFQALRENETQLNQYYYHGTLSSQYSEPSFKWITKEGHQLSVEADTGAVSGSLKIKSLKVTYVKATPATSVRKMSSLPSKFTLDQNYPNPFNPTTEIKYQISMAGNVTLKVFDALGREIATIVNEQESPGVYAVRFNGEGLASGMYIYQLRTGTSVETKRMVLMK
jgi:Secretion system C-terminal sorting domain